MSEPAEFLALKGKKTTTKILGARLRSFKRDLTFHEIKLMTWNEETKRAPQVISSIRKQNIDVAEISKQTEQSITIVFENIRENYYWKKIELKLVAFKFCYLLFRDLLAQFLNGLEKNHLWKVFASDYFEKCKLFQQTQQTPAKILINSTRQISHSSWG